MCPRIMRSEPPKKNKWLNRKPLDKLTKMWYNEYSQEGEKHSKGQQKRLRAQKRI